MDIFKIDSPEVLPIVMELGFANLSFGLVGIISLFKSQWRVVSAFASGLYYLLAGGLHFFKERAGFNEEFALWTDLILFAILFIYVIKNIRK